MEWLSFATIAYLMWAFGNLLSKIIISRYVKSITVNLIIVGIWGLFPLFLAPSQGGLVIPNTNLLLLILFSGVLHLYILIPYFKALSIEEASRVVPLWRFTPLFILLFSGGLTHEKLAFEQLIAFFLLVIGGFLVSVKDPRDLFKFSQAFYLMLFASFLNGIYSSIAKFIYLEMPFYDGFTLMRVGISLSAFALLLIPRNRVEVTRTFRQMSYPVKGLVLLNALLELIGLALYNWAVSVAPVSLVSASAGIQAIFVVILSIVLSVKFPQFWHEEMSRSILMQKGVAIALIVIGTGIIGLHASL
jgi:uncharacterized membrane protein